MSTSFAPIAASTDTTALDPTKHVLYQLGMVLGVADLSQDFTWLSTRDEVAVRELAGYGTVTGLRVVADVDTHGPRVVVEPGTAYSPKGELIRLCKSQCAYLDDWLLQNNSDVSSKRDKSAQTATLYVVLCYRDCPTDNVPIPGAPCRTEDQAMQPSRLSDDFTLEFRWQAPDQKEADAIHGFVHWLRRVKAVSMGPALTLHEFEAELLADEDAILAVRCGDDHHISSPPDSPPSSPPHIVFEETPIPIPAGSECEYLRAAFRIWTTRFRPRIHPDLMAGACGCGGGSPSGPDVIEGCLLLAELVVPLSSLGTAFVVNRATPVEIRQKCRPTLVDLQMLQEYVLCALHGQDLLPGGVTPAKSFGLPVTNGVLDLYARADHSHGTPDLPKVDGEVKGDIGATVVSKILGLPMNAGPTTNGQVLTISRGAWTPAAVASPNPGPVVAAQTFGLIKSDGASNAYARADHSHGTPPFEILTKSVGLSPTGAALADGQILIYNANANQWQPGAIPVAPPPLPLPVQVVAGGVFRGDGTAIQKNFGKLTATPIPSTIPGFTVFTLKFSAFKPASTYLVKGTIIVRNVPAGVAALPQHVLERLVDDDQNIEKDQSNNAIRIRITRGPNEELTPAFSLEISEIL